MNNKNINIQELNYKKIKYLDIQLIAILGFIFAFFISFLLSYDKKLSIEHKKRIFDNYTAQQLALFQTILVFVISSTFLYINYRRYVISKQLNDGKEKDELLQIETSVLSIISAIIGLYIIFKNYKNQTLSTAETDLSQ